MRDFFRILKPRPKSVAVLIAAVSIFISADAQAADCDPVLKPTKYKVQKGDHIAAILRTLKLEPVFGKGQSVEQLLKINNVPNPDLIEPNIELQIPFSCEQQVKVWQSEDRGADRLLIRKKSEFIKIDFSETEASPKVKLEPQSKAVVTEQVLEETPVATQEKPPSVVIQNTTEDILDKNVPLKDNADLDPVIQPSQQEVSDALRYRMICEGEWTGTECVTRYSNIFGTFGAWNNRYDGIDNTVAQNNQGVLLSKLNPEGGIGWQNYWTENIKTVLYASSQWSQMLPEAQEVPIDSPKKWLGNFYGQIRFEKGKWGVGASFRQHDKIFFRYRVSGLSQPCIGPSQFAGCGVFVHIAAVSEISLDLSYMLFQQGKFRYDLTGIGTWIGPAATGGFEVEPGFGAGINFRITHDRVKEYVYGEMTYRSGAQNTSIETQKYQNLGFTFGYAWKLKDW